MTDQKVGRIAQEVSEPKALWTTPVLQTLDLDKAQGAEAGGSADRFGSLSTP
jgi:hypothetical protein